MPCTQPNRALAEPGVGRGVAEPSGVGRARAGEPEGAIDGGGRRARPGPVRLGLALGGGAALGAAHVGVLQALEEAGVRFDVVAGTSAGAIIGGAYAADFGVARLASAVEGAKFADFAEWTSRGRWGLLDSGALERSVDRAVGRIGIEDLPIPFGAVAFDLRTRTPVVLDSGPLATALRASSAVPGLFPPVPLGERLLVDGGVAANLPVAAARGLGADRVLAVSLDGGDARRMTVRLAERARTLAFGDPDAADAAAVHLLHPDTRGASRWSPRDVPRLIAAGRQAVEEAWPTLEPFLAPHPTAPLP
ncbi:patatin-like phospholipase family protein [Actinocorallia sp. A-T 12471]|uniref:patatin-like phospholipase family protein n=1 Tax=Actinocorallia sp. A-T 12471 TaxID=3089813 RepID=UPI0029D13CAB|nr:patatin-like phospholipase family protein [Actinocorallia sp. A-T 12471]MDX6741670.1 patatin-like phospholipase family protein [Actinocorallia sp. A-T 12471]